MQLVVLSAPRAAVGAQRSIGIRDGQFVLDGAPFQFIAGEMHYPRVPHQYWRHRLQMARAMGLNTISTYVFWNLHEPNPGSYDFSGQNDVAAYVRAAQEAGLHVILRPGPYVCAEWDFGGLPAWLLRDPQTLCRTRDERFMGPARRWLGRLGQELAGLQWPRGGPILAVAVENEYGSFGSDHEYMAAIHDAIVEAGFDDVILYTEDGVEQMSDGALPSLPVAGSVEDPQTDFPAIARVRPGNPVMAGEYYPGWFDHWGEPHHVTDVDGHVRDLEFMLARGSCNLYVFHGGTNWFMNGANYGDVPYQPTTTSYDYDAPLSEACRPTAKFFRFRDVIARHARVQPPLVPAASAFTAIDGFTLDESARYEGLLGAPIASDAPQYMEAYGQSYGYVLYRTRAPRAMQGPLRAEVRDYAVVFVDGQRIGTYDRRLKQSEVDVTASKPGSTIDILVENTGRLNYGKAFIQDRKGIIGDVTLGGETLRGWQAFTLPMDDVSKIGFTRSMQPYDAPAFYRGRFTLERLADTYLDVRMLGKGLLWVNGHAVGRFWEIGPQFALYVPAPFLRAGRNDVVVFDLLDRSVRSLSGRTEPLFAPISE